MNLDEFLSKIYEINDAYNNGRKKVVKTIPMKDEWKERYEMLDEIESAMKADLKKALAKFIEDANRFNHAVKSFWVEVERETGELGRMMVNEKKDAIEVLGHPLADDGDGEKSTSSFEEQIKKYLEEEGEA